ncbi:MAG TPA: hypothetical protein VGU66_17950 [Candidatus Elarobacter sp.]|nr:hypothetical protein [Candidatus Elarobacter sp.]
MIAARPLAIAEIFDRTVTLVVQRWRIVLAIVAITATPDAMIVAVTRGHDTTRAAMAFEFVTVLLVGALTFSPLVRVGGDAAAPDDLGALLRRAVADYWRSLGSFLLVYAVLIVVLVGIAVVVAFAALSAGFVLGSLALPVTVVGLGLAACALVPLLVVTSVAYANVILERVSPWRGLVSAVARCRQASLARTWLLGAALLIVSFVPALVLDPLLRGLSAGPGMWWVLLPEPYLTTATGVAFGTIAGAVAAVDYRNRSEGADLHAVLDATATNTGSASASAS